MDEQKRMRLEAEGWKFGDAEDFLDDLLPPRSYTVEYVDAVTCPRCGHETHPDAVNETCRGNHWTDEDTP